MPERGPGPLKKRWRAIVLQDAIGVLLIAGFTLVVAIGMQQQGMLASRGRVAILAGLVVAMTLIWVICRRPASGK